MAGTVYKTLKDLRLDNDKRQIDIAEYLRCDQSLYSKYERGERDIPFYIMEKLADYYETSLDYIAGRTDNPVPYKKVEEKDE